MTLANYHRNIPPGSRAERLSEDEGHGTGWRSQNDGSILFVQHICPRLMCLILPITWLVWIPHQEAAAVLMHEQTKLSHSGTNADNLPRLYDESDTVWEALDNQLSYRQSLIYPRSCSY
jgi:hypothetical protein